MVRSFSSAGSRPWSSATRSPASGPAASSAWTSSTAASGRCGGDLAVLVDVDLVALALLWVSPLMRGHTT